MIDRPPQRTFDLAQKREKESGQPQYIVRTHDAEGEPSNFIITARMPMLGEWYTTDQLQHG